MSVLFSKATLGSLSLQNHLVMCPLTRSRAIGNVPNDLMARVLRQRASAGLIITEGTSPSPNGLGYARIPGIYSDAQVAGWKKVTDAVHARGGKIFVQLMHTGRIGHPLNLPAGAKVLAPSAVAAAGQMFTDAEGMKPHPVPAAMTEAELKSTIAEYAKAATNAVAAGFDGIELHAANGYLLEQFIRPNSNQRTDAYGGAIENRARFVLEVVEASIAAIGKDKVGIRLSPYRRVQRHAALSGDGAGLRLSGAEAERGGPGLCPPRRSFRGRRAAGARIDQGDVPQHLQAHADPVGRL